MESGKNMSTPELVILIRIVIMVSLKLQHFFIKATIWSVSVRYTEINLIQHWVNIKVKQPLFFCFFFKSRQRHDVVYTDIAATMTMCVRVCLEAILEHLCDP